MLQQLEVLENVKLPDELNEININQLQGLNSQIENQIAKECRHSLFTFVKEFWEIIIDDEPVWNWHIPYICSLLEKVFYRVMMKKVRKRDLIINIPPGTSKSTIVTVMFQVWCWIAELPKHKFPKFYVMESKKKGIPVSNLHIRGSYLRFITGSYAEKLSIEHSEYAKNIITSDKFSEYFPEVKLKKDKQAKSNFVNTSKGQRFTTSVGATVTGVHAHIIIIDDPVDPNKAISDLERETANRWTDQTLSTRKVDKKVTTTIVIMQRLHEDDPTGHMLNKRGKNKIHHVVLPDCTDWEIKPHFLEKNYKPPISNPDSEIRLLDPIRLPKSVIEEQKTTMGAYGYSGQFGQNPRPREGALFQEEWFEIVDAVPEPVEKRVRGWDMAATSEAEAAIKNVDPAYSAGVLMSRKDNVFYIEHVWRGRVGPKPLRIAMRNLATQDGKPTIIDFPQDPGQAGKAQAMEVAAILSGYIVKFSPETGDKLLRLEPLSSQCEAGNVKLVRGGWNEKFLYELCSIPTGKYWDQADAASRAFNNLHIPIGKNAGGW